MFGFSLAGQRANWLASPARSVDPLRPDENPKLCSAAGRAYLALPAASSLQLAGRSSESGITSLPGKHSETLFGIGQPDGCLRGSSCLAAARCQDLPETLFASGAWRHQVQLAVKPPAEKKPNIYLNYCLTCNILHIITILWDYPTNNINEEF